MASRVQTGSYQVGSYTAECQHSQLHINLFISAIQPRQGKQMYQPQHIVSSYETDTLHRYDYKLRQRLNNK